MNTTPQPDREQTDESLRNERERVDHAFDEALGVADETADEVISRARARADALLAAARAKTDRAAPSAQPADVLTSSRALEDQVLQRERGTADAILLGERAEHMALLSHERAATDHDLSQERARSDHALATRDEFMAIVSHDLRNMLNAIVGASGVIMQEAARDDHVEQVLAHARRIQRAGVRMGRLVGDLVDVASIEAGKLAVTRSVGDPADLVTEAVETFQAQAAGRGISLVREIVLPLPPAAFDPPRILQVLYNLLSNALKFTTAPGTVVVRVEHVEDSTVFSVSDTGVGIPVDKLEAIFDRFVQLAGGDGRGVGLGLFISKCIVHGHDGRIWAENRVHKGTTVSFTLPDDAGIP
jgi:signal transduction histidine kinase